VSHLRPLVPGDATPDALVTDQYLDALLGAADPRATDGSADDELDPAIRYAATVLRASLVRVHPSFRFEDRLAARLVDLAAERRGRVAVGGADVLPFPGLTGDHRHDPLLDAVFAGALDPSDAVAVDRASVGRAGGRPLLVGGALTSAAISIVGVAFVAWRASRPGASPMSRGAMMRAVRLAHVRRAALAAGAGGPA
jgi:hypothetical protein